MGKALYRKYRPDSFEGVIGQPHITATLQNQLKSGRVGHAYLFCGSRGVGKTSLARIFAHAVNCLAVKNAPCGKCEACVSGAGDNNLDIIEIDAASNNGVDDARDLREKINYPPVLGRYKIYIIDEVHMLTGSAFNALLKTLEEPPSHAVFILATTEPHKLPATILSRCMRFDFKLVGMQQLFTLLAEVFDREGKEYQDEALRAIAAAAEGSVRDALSLADTCMNLTDGVLTAAQVADVLGGGNDQTELLLDAIAKQNLAAALSLVGELYENGKSMTVIAKELALCARDLMIAKTAPAVLKTTNERLNLLTKAAESHSIESLAAMVQLFSEIDGALRYSVNPRIAMEAAVVRAIKLYSLDLTALDERILRIERRLDNLKDFDAGSAPVKNAEILANTQSRSKIRADLEGSPDLAADNYSIADKINTNSISDTPANAKSPDLNTSFKKNNGGFEDIPPPAEDNVPYDNTGFNGSFNTQNNTGGTNDNLETNNTPLLSATQLWGRVITFFRRNSTPALTQAVGRQNPAKLTLKKDSLTIAASREDYLIMCDPQLLEVLKNALSSENYNLKIIVEKDSQDIDMEKEVLRLYDEIGKDKVKIIK